MGCFMDKTFSLSLPYPVSSNRYWRSFSQKNRATVVLSPEAKAYKEEVGLRAKVAGIRNPIIGRVALKIRLYPTRPEDAEARIRKHGAAWDATVKCIDLDNSLKVLIDSLKGIAYVDDDQVWSINAERMTPDGPGRVEIEIQEIVIKAMPIHEEYQLVSSGALPACYGKQAFETEALARAIAKRKTRGYSLEHYRCKECGKWHIGNHTGYVQNKKVAAKLKGTRDAEQ